MLRINKNPGLKLCLLAVFSYLNVATSVAAEFNTDLADHTPPLFIQPPRVTPATTDQPLTITAYVTDDVGVRSVTLHYRFGRIAPYFQLSENRAYKKLELALTPTGDYVAEIPRDEVAGNVLEYYVEVADMAGNRASKGLAGQPFIMTFVASQVSSNLVRLTNPENPGQPALIPAEEQRAKAAVIVQPGSEEDSSDKAIAWYQQRWVWAVAGGVVLAAALGGGGGGGSSSPTGSVTVIAPPTQ